MFNLDKKVASLLKKLHPLLNAEINFSKRKRTFSYISMSNMGLLLIALVFMLYACGESSSVDESNPVEQAYANCMKQTMEKFKEDNKGKEFPPKFMEAIKKSVESSCQIIKRECEKDPDGPVCQGLLERYGRK